MKKTFFIVAILMMCKIVTNAQTNLIGTITIQTLLDKYTVANTYDSTFARVAEIELDDTVNINLVEVYYTNLATNEMIYSSNFQYTALTNSIDYNGSNALSRNKKLLSFYLGFLPFDKRYHFVVKLKDANGDYTGDKSKEF